MIDSLLTRIANEVGTPTYVYDLDKVTEQLKILTTALPEATVFYAAKANPCAAVLRHLATQDVGAEVISLGELERVVRAGIAPERIVLGGPRQDLALIERALALGVSLVSLDSVSQWSTWKHFEADVQFLIRVNPALDPRTHEHLATGAATSKFGMTVAEAELLAAELAEQNKLAGFHVHAGSQITASEVYDEIFSVLTPLYEKYPTAKVLDIGGGFGVPSFDVKTFASKVKAFAKQFSLKIMIEPGRFLVAAAGVLLSTVLHEKAGGLKHIIADAGMSDLLRPALYNAKHPIRVIGKENTLLDTVDVDGPLCENADRLARNIELPVVQAGDLLVIEQAGAYGFAMSSNYASSLRPAEVVSQAETYQIARDRESIEDLIRLER